MSKMSKNEFLQSVRKTERGAKKSPIHEDHFLLLLLPRPTLKNNAITALGRRQHRRSNKVAWVYETAAGFRFQSSEKTIAVKSDPITQSIGIVTIYGTDRPYTGLLAQPSGKESGIQRWITAAVG